MVAEILIIPDNGAVDSAKAGAQYIARSLHAIGIKTRDNTSLCGDKIQLQQAVSLALERSNIVMIIGGMDKASGFMAKTVVSQGLGLALVSDPKCLLAIRNYCLRAGEIAGEDDSLYADLPQGAIAFPPAHGKVPGCVVSSASQHIFLLPDTQQELAAMFGRYMAPLLSGNEASSTVTHILRTYGAREEFVREKLASFLVADNPAVTLQRDENEVLIRVSAHGAQGREAASLCAPVLKDITRTLGDIVYGLDVDSLQSAVVGKMHKRGLKLAVAEAGTAGVLTRIVDETPGGQELLVYSAEADDTDIKLTELTIDPKLLKKRGPVSEYTAVAMADGARRQGEADIGLAIAANTDDWDDRRSEPGLVYIAVCDTYGVYVKKLVVGDLPQDSSAVLRDVIVDAATSRALNMLRLFVDYYPGTYKGCINLEEALKGKTVTDKDSYDEDCTDLAPQKGFLGLFFRFFGINKTDSAPTKARKWLFFVLLLLLLGSAGYLFALRQTAMPAAKIQPQRTVAVWHKTMADNTTLPASSGFWGLFGKPMTVNAAAPAHGKKAPVVQAPAVTEPTTQPVTTQIPTTIPTTTAPTTQPTVTTSSPAQLAEAERLAAEKAEADRLAAEKAAAEKAEAERLAAEKDAADKLAAEKAAAEKLAAEKAAAEKLAAEKLAVVEKAANTAAGASATAEKNATAAMVSFAAGDTPKTNTYLEQAWTAVEAAYAAWEEALAAAEQVKSDAAGQTVERAYQSALAAEASFQHAEEAILASSGNTTTTPSGSGGTGSSTNAGTLTVYINGKKVTGDALDIIARVTQNEVGSGFHLEAIKAQAVAAYTYILQGSQGGKIPSVYASATASDKVRNAVAQVLGETITYNGKLAFTPYHATSAGATTSSAAVWGGSYPYLVSVDSAIEETLNTFAVETTFTRAKVESLLSSVLGITADGDPADWFEVESYEAGGYNGNMRVCGQTKSRSGSRLTGRLLRESVFGLRSACFTVDYDDRTDNFIFTTYGYGHGVGMSQNGANLYATKEGWSYVDILEHYYPGTVVG